MTEPRTDAALIARFAALPVATISDVQQRLNVCEPEIRAVWAGAQLAGPAFTVQTAGGDNKVLHDTLDQVPAGSVLVVNGQAARHRALIGELMAARALRRGIAGMVIDGAVRDVPGLARLGFPVFARSVSAAGPYRNGPGHAGLPVAIGGVAVLPGDLVIGDADGVVIVSPAGAEEIVTLAERKAAREDAELAGLVRDIDGSRRTD